MKKRLIGYVRKNEEVVVENGIIFVKEKFDVLEWAERILKVSYSSAYYDCHILPMARTVVVFDLIDKNKKPGIAICNPKDKFNAKIGKAIALCRLNGVKIPKEILK